MRILVAALLCAAALIALIPAAAQAGSPDLPPRPIPDLPPRPGGPTPAPAPEGGLIELILHFDPSLAPTLVSWQTQVQWQDGLGEWHNVEGWRGTADELHNDWGRKSWWLDREHLGTGPFRWVIYSDGSEEPIKSSDKFFAPTGDGGITRTSMTLP